MAAFIASQREQHRIPAAVACRALGASRSWFCKWKGGASGPRAQRRQQLGAEVKRLFARHEGKYGSPRITAGLREQGWRVSENTVAKLMAEQQLAARRKKRRRAATRPGKGRWRAPDLVRRDFPAAQLNRKWFGDGTEIRTGEGKLYLASVLDVGSRRVPRAAGAGCWPGPWCCRQGPQWSPGSRPARRAVAERCHRQP